MNTKSLKIFNSVMQKGSFAAVARDLDADPSAISRTIANLEKELGIRLLHRSTRRLVPTEAGLVYFNRIESILEQLEQAENIAADTGEQVTGTLRITAPTSFGLTHLSSVIPEFLNTYPHLSVEILMTNSIVDLLQERVDVALRLSSLSDSSLIAQKLFDIDYVICATEEYLSLHGKPASPNALKNHNCLVFPVPGYASRWKFKNSQGVIDDIEIKGRCSITNSLAIKQCVVANLGIALLPQWSIKQELDDNSLKDLFPDYKVTATDFDIAGWLLYPSRKYLPIKTRQFIEFMKHKFQETT